MQMDGEKAFLLYDPKETMPPLLPVATGDWRMPLMRYLDKLYNSDEDWVKPQVCLLKKGTLGMRTLATGMAPCW
jgi:hypothetical protein